MLTTSSYQEVLDKARHLTPDEQLRLLEELAAIVRQQISTEPLHSLLELEGLGQEVWEGIDAQKYIDEERDTWNG
jgi:DNA-binding HxlR family transcriptional regulator